MTHGTYIFDATWAAELDRLQALERGWDPTTIDSLEDAGVAAGWRCLEVGAGAGSVALWLADRVGASGRVVATDLDTRFLEPLADPPLEVRRHDILRDALEQHTYDLVHARLLLEHLPGAEVALESMAEALKPGGVLVIEDFDHQTLAVAPDSSTDDRDAWSAFEGAFKKLAGQRGLNLSFGLHLPDALERAVLTDVNAQCRAFYERGGSDRSRALRLSIETMRQSLLATGQATAETLDYLVARLHDASFHWVTQLMVTATGRAPAR